MRLHWDDRGLALGPIDYTGPSRRRIMVEREKWNGLSEAFAEATA
jgi:hypothetical protein